MAEQTLAQILEEGDDEDFLMGLGVPLTSRGSPMRMSDAVGSGSEDATVGSSPFVSAASEVFVKEKAVKEREKSYLPKDCSPKEGEPREALLLPQPLSRISQALVSPKMRAEVGFPTCLAVGRLIAIGTAHGAALLFDHNQQLKQKLGGVGDRVEECDPVTSLAIATDQEWIATGHQR